MLGLYEEEVGMFRILMGLIGVAGLVAAAALLFGGGSLLLFEDALTDEGGFFTSVPLEIAADGYAVVAGPAEIDLAPDIPVNLGEIAAVRIRATQTDPTRGIFVGIAEPAEIESYLGDAPYAIVSELDAASFSLTDRVDATGEPPAAPAMQTFWIDSAHGPGPQTVTWEIEARQVAFVVMNDDVAGGIRFDAVVSVRLPLRPAARGLLRNGGVVLAVGALLIALAL
jgi:hypothetical protein